MVMSHMGLSCINKETYQYFQSILMNDTGEGIGTPWMGRNRLIIIWQSKNLIYKYRVRFNFFFQIANISETMEEWDEVHTSTRRPIDANTSSNTIFISYVCSCVLSIGVRVL